ncbi:MAG: DGQHR domain-containing protein, partial [Candidatus Paceibacterota bacterium]
MNNRVLEFPCVPVKQPLGEFYIGSIPSKDLIEITKVDIRRIEGEKGFETYLGIQRPKNERRVKEIAKYTKTEDACFPTAVILAVSGNCVTFNSEKNVLILSEYIDEENPDESIKFNEIANVLDGQHRIEGLKEANIQNDFEINLSIFIDIDIADQGIHPANYVLDLKFCGYSFL